MSPSNQKPRVGAQLYTVRECCKTVEEVTATMKKVAAIGYKFVQISGMGELDLVQAGKMAIDSGLAVAATHVGWEGLLTQVDKVIADHQAIGCRHVAIGGLSAEYLSLEGIQKLASELAPVAAALRAAGMDFSYHNHDHEFIKIDGKCWLTWLYQNISGSVLKAELDTFWVQSGGGDPAEWVRTVGGRQPLLHLKDMVWVRTEKGFERRFAEIGAGNLNWPRILESAEKVGVEYLLVEQDRCYERTPFESLEISYRNLKAFGYE